MYVEMILRVRTAQRIVLIRQNWEGACISGNFIYLFIHERNAGVNYLIRAVLSNFVIAVSCFVSTRYPYTPRFTSWARYSTGRCDA